MTDIHPVNVAETRPSRPLVLIDFDGVINQFPDEKVRRRQNSTRWLKPNDPRIRLYAPDNWFIPDHKESITIQYHGRLRLLWSGELVERLKALDAQIIWLSTWQPYTVALNLRLGTEWETAYWYDPVTQENRHTGKRRTVIDHLADGRPIIWIDDEETTYNAGLALIGNEPQAPVLAIGSDTHIGISRSQMSTIERFVSTPPADPEVRFEISRDGNNDSWRFGGDSEQLLWNPSEVGNMPDSGRSPRGHTGL